MGVEYEYTFVLDYKLVSLGNTRLHHFAKAKYVKGLRSAGYLKTSGLRLPKGRPPTRVDMVRHSARMFDSDNLVSAFKPLRDGIAQALGIDDSERTGLRWHYGQVKAANLRPGMSCLIVTISREERLD